MLCAWYTTAVCGKSDHCVLEISHILTAQEAAPSTALKQQLVNFPSVGVTLLGLVTGGIH